MDQPQFSLKKLEEFIGRESILNDVRGWLEDGKFHPVFFSGEYGVGKTRLLQRILELANKELKYDGAPTRLIDLYHFRHHSPEGLARAIFACFEDTENEYYFNPFITARRRLEAARAGGNNREIHEQLKKLLDTCIDGVKKISAEHGILLLFDTAEQFVYPTGTRFAPAWDWLKGWIGNLPCGVALFAGRPSASALFQQTSFRTEPLGFFVPDESRAFMMAAADRYSKQTGLSVDLAEDFQRTHDLSEGRPILLAMYVDLRMRNPRAFKDLSELQTKTFEQQVIEELFNLPELGDTLRSAGRLQKGINRELLAKIRGISLQEAETSLEILKPMSFTKVFPDDDRVYLHDEMYDLLERYVYSVDADVAERQFVAQAIYEYYRSAIEKKDKELGDIFTDLTQDGHEQLTLTPKEYVDKIRKIEASRQRLKTESVYYRLRNQVGKEDKRKWFEDDPIYAGLKIYYRYNHEAATSSNDEILIPLQIELTNFWLEMDDENSWKPFIEGMLYLHDVWIRVATGQQYWDIIPNLERRLADIKKLSKDQKVILHALLETWLGTGLVFAKQPDYNRAEKVFSDSIETLRAVSTDQNLDWFKNIALSLALRQRAYLYHSQGNYQSAMKDYQDSLRYIRVAGFYHEEATLRNDLGLSQTQMGKFRSAFENMWDGLQLRYRVAVAPRIALSHSSLAQHFIFTGGYEDARMHANSAIRISDAVEFKRGKAFGNLELAEASRRFAFASIGSVNRHQHLEQAKKAIESAVFLFDELGETTLRVEAKLEDACYYRDFMRIETDNSNKRTWFEISDKKLREVEAAANDARIEHRSADAISNRVWLGYYAGNVEYALQAFKDFEHLEILAPYWLENGKFHDREKVDKNPILLTRIGKCYIARGLLALDEWKRNKEDSVLFDAARYLMLGMTYNEFFAKDHRGIREARRAVYLSLAALHEDELRTFSNHVIDAEKSEALKSPSVLQDLMIDHALWFT